MVVALEPDAAPRCTRLLSATPALTALATATLAAACMLLNACSHDDRAASPAPAASDGGNSNANSFNANAFNSNDAATLPAHVADTPAAPSASAVLIARPDTASTPLAPPVIHTVD